ncbi:MAG: hypothetical protein WCP65_00595 [Bacteroidota bacterium]
MKLLLRFVTVMCYFLPFTFFFVTCNKGDIEYSFAYNQSDADRNVKIEKESVHTETLPARDTIGDENIDTNKIGTIIQSVPLDTLEKHSVTLPEKPNYFDSVCMKALRPTKKSLSGIGCMNYYKNRFGEIVISIAFIISIFLFLVFKFIKSKRIITYLLILKLICLVIFILDCYVSRVTLLWGCWFLLILIIVQLILELSKEEKAYR